MTKILILFSLFFAQNSYAYLSLMSTGEILPENQYRVSGELQDITTDGEGANVLVSLDTPFREDMNFRFEAGTGATDYALAGFLKWVPFPDLDTQPAIGIMGGVSFSGNHGYSSFSALIKPFISKTYEFEFGHFTPYGGLTTGSTSSDGHSSSPLFVHGGMEWKPKDLPQLNFMGEIGFDINDAFNYISISASYYFASIAE